MDRISDLPKDILQRILYLLSQEDAVRTSVLSKSWRYIWCTRPNLDFSDSNFKGNNQQFLSTVGNTLQLYSDQRLCLDEFRLSILLVDHEWVSLLEKWIPLLADMGVKDFRLSIPSDYSNREFIDLPVVVFKAESLKSLHLYRFNLGKNIPENILFVRLQVLQLSHVVLHERGVFDKIMSSCPLLTDLWLQECKGLETVKLEKKLHKYLKHFTFINRTNHAGCSIEIDVPTLVTIRIIGCKIRFNCREFSNLKIITLREEDARSWFLGLSKLLHGLRRSEISLSIFQFATNNVHVVEDEILVQDIINGGNKPVVVLCLELDIGHLSSFSSFLNGLFCICRPSYLIPRWVHGPWSKERKAKELDEFFCKIQKMKESGNEEIRRYLEDLTIEGFDKEFRVRLQWRDRDCECNSKLSES
ncbi:hypothetical protein MIMGU_mgv1a007194mg [Erythranthe guttata]|uniref:F-box domain-containing protein n=1 Tax=Erythranthe guttata TaxID=4155 RepID=A0A022QQF5_ERYGU|nr:hypothetical protein MIMGU_mgv1a007194mg [Erythranthe guttata]